MQQTNLISKNIMEDLVDGRLDELMRFSGVCCCERCRADVRTLSLNTLPAKYVMSTSGDVYVRFQSLEPQMQADIVTAIMNAIEVVRANPRHDKYFCD